MQVLELMIRFICNWNLEIQTSKREKINWNAPCRVDRINLWWKQVFFFVFFLQETLLRMHLGSILDVALSTLNFSN